MYYWSNKSLQEDDKQLFDDLPEKLKFEINVEANKFVLNSSKFLNNNFSMGFKFELLKSAEAVSLFPDTYLEDESG